MYCTGITYVKDVLDIKGPLDLPISLYTLLASMQCKIIRPRRDLLHFDSIQREREKGVDQNAGLSSGVPVVVVPTKPTLGTTSESSLWSDVIRRWASNDILLGVVAHVTRGVREDVRLHPALEMARIRGD